MPENESDPPQFNPRASLLAGASVRFSAAARSINSRISFRAASTVPRVPPEACSVRPMQSRRCRARAIAPQIVIDLIDLAT